MLCKEELSGDNQYHCDFCGKKVDATRQLCLRQLPPYLCMSLQRFVFDMKVTNEFVLSLYNPFPRLSCSHVTLHLAMQHSSLYSNATFHTEPLLHCHSDINLLYCIQKELPCLEQHFLHDVHCSLCVCDVEADEGQG